MTITVEDGTGLADAESYVSAADCAAYAAKRGLSFPDSPAAPAESALIIATAYIDSTYRGRFPGQRVKGRNQALEWPRAYATDIGGNDIAADEVPVEIINATCEAAIRELASPGTLSPDFDRDSYVKRQKAGSVEIEYGANARPGTSFTLVDSALSNILRSNSGGLSIRAVRA